MLIAEYLDKWLETAVRQRVTERTFGGYGALIDRYVKTSPLAAMKLSDVRAPHV